MYAREKDSPLETSIENSSLLPSFFATLRPEPSLALRPNIGPSGLAPALRPDIGPSGLAPRPAGPRAPLPRKRFASRRTKAGPDEFQDRPLAGMVFETAGEGVRDSKS